LLHFKFQGHFLYLDAAEQGFTKLITLDPDDSTAYNNLGIVKGLQADYKEADVAFDKAILRNPEDPSAYRNHALVDSFECSQRHSLSSCDSAIANFQRAEEIQLLFGAEPKLDSYSYVRWGLALLEDGQYRAGRSKLDEAVDAGRDKWKILYLDALAHYAADEYKEAEAKLLMVTDLARHHDDEVVAAAYYQLALLSRMMDTDARKVDKYMKLAIEADRTATVETTGDLMSSRKNWKDLSDKYYNKYGHLDWRKNPWVDSLSF
jgi:tetratricopeptide (TPR) repeat protein